MLYVAIDIISDSDDENKNKNMYSISRIYDHRNQIFWDKVMMTNLKSLRRPLFLLIEAA